MERPTNEFDCDDFAWAFDAECAKAGIPCWEASMFSWPSFFGKGTGHVVAIVKMDQEFTIYERFVLVEPQSNKVIISWLQEKGETPEVPKSLYKKLAKEYDWFDEPYQRINVFSGGLSPRAGEAPFTKLKAIRDRYRRKTGYDPASYTP